MTALSGRQRETAVLAEVGARLAKGVGGAVWVEGGPGIGKTALVHHALDGFPAGVTRFQGRAGRRTEDLPLAAIASSLGLGKPAPDPARAEIATLIDDLSPAHVPADLLLAAAERMLDLIADEIARAPVVLVVDDIQWADEFTLGLLSRLLHHTGAEQIALILLSRVGRPRPLVQRLRNAVVSAGRLMSLGPLDDRALLDLAAKQAGTRLGSSVAGQLARCGGNPFYAAELLADLQARGAIRVVDRVAELEECDYPLPGSIAASIDQWVATASEHSRPLLEVAAHLGSAFTVGELAIAGGENPAGLDALVRAGLLVDNGDHFTFRHDMLRQRLLEGTPRSTSEELHLRIAERFRRHDAPAAVVAHHVAAAGASGLPLAAAWLPGLPIEQLLGFAGIAEGLLSALISTDLLGPTVWHRAAVAVARLRAWIGLDARRLLDQLIAESRDAPEAAELALLDARMWAEVDEPETAVARLVEATTRTGLPPALLARLRSWLAFGRGAVPGADPAAALRAAEAAVDAADETADATAIATAHLVVSRLPAADWRRRAEHIRRGLAVPGSNFEQTDLRFSLLGGLYALRAITGRPDFATEVEDALADAEPRSSRVAVTFRGLLAELAFLRGDWDKALEYSAAEPVPTLIGASIQFLRGKPEHARALLIDSNTAGMTLPRVLDRYVSGDRDGALDQARRWLDTEPFLSLRPSWDAPALVGLLLAAGESKTAAEVVATRAARLAAARLPDDPMQRYLAALAGADAATLGRSSIELQDFGMPPLSAVAAVHAALAYARDNQPDTAREHLTRAARTFGELGAGWAVQAADARLRDLGVRRGPRSRSKPRTTRGSAALTPTELTIATLIAQGASNPQIAAGLVISRRTVEVHVSRILAKLQIRSRKQVAEAMTGRIV